MQVLDSDAVAESAETLDAVRRELGKVFVGQEELAELLLVAVVADGHVLVESVPGLGKTTLVKTFGRILGLDTNRIQFTPDLMPSDITGSHVFDMAERRFTFRQGPVFTRFLLADEFNRSPAKTHAALLEAMQEYQVTLDGQRYPLERPFLVMATQNPIENEGTYNLPEAQLDRFLFKLVLPYPQEGEEEEILAMFLAGSSPAKMLIERVEQVTDGAGLQRLQDRGANVAVQKELIAYIAAIVRRTRGYPGLYLGGSPRAGISILRAARSLALIRGRGFATPEDVGDVVVPALRHRMILSPEAEIEGRTTDGIVEEIVAAVPVPRGDALPGGTL